MESKNRKKKLSMTSALLVVAMISLVGVGFALEYTGSVTTDIPDEKGEYITASLVKDGFTAGVYSVNTMNNGTNVALSDLKVNNSSATMYTAGHFTYSSGFTWVTGAPVANGYYASKVGTFTLTLTQPTTATATSVTLSASGAQGAVVNEYGLSYIYTYKTTAEGSETVFDPSGDLAVTMTSGSATVYVCAYVVYSSVVPVGSIGSISTFALSATLANGVVFTATASDA